VSPLVELSLQIGYRGSATVYSRRLLAVLDRRRLPAPCFHCYAAYCCTRLASGHVANAIEVTSGHPLMKPSHDAQDHGKGRRGYHSDADAERGLDQGQRARAQCTIRRPLGPRWVIFVRSTRFRHSRHVRFAPIASEPSHRSDSTRCARSGREQMQQCEAKITRSPRRQWRAAMAAQ
jgi:hypothetical protein